MSTLNARTPKPTSDGWIKDAVVWGGLLPTVILVWDALTGQLGANPLQRAEQQTGVLALAMLLLSLSCTPLRLLGNKLGQKWVWPIRVRKHLGLLSAWYALVHVVIYVLDKGLIPSQWWYDILKRPYITVGFLALLILVTLAFTSGKGAVRRMGFKRWEALHRLTYLAGILVVVHYWWAVKKDLTGPIVALVLLLLGFAARALIRNRMKPRAERKQKEV